MEIPNLFNEIQKPLHRVSHHRVSLLTNQRPFPILGPGRDTLSQLSQTYLLGIPVGRAVARFRRAQTPHASISPGDGCLVFTHFPLRLFHLSDTRNHPEAGMTSEKPLASGSFNAVSSTEGHKNRSPKTLTMKGMRRQ